MQKKVDWAAISNKLRPDTAKAITAFRSRHTALLKQVSELREQQAAINFDQYSVLKNQQVVTEAKKALANFQAQKYDLKQQLDIIEKEKQKAVMEL
jgi:F-type H+-transporting ATPase subunit d